MPPRKDAPPTPVNEEKPVIKPSTPVGDKRDQSTPQPQSKHEQDEHVDNKETEKEEEEDEKEEKEEKE
ncbi:hypothetical protein M0802_013253 [Mischocyttarus mexicanus]|nr:hypothetical protein M0802_013253 [Mischocyttarus mexicanus]